MEENIGTMERVSKSHALPAVVKRNESDGAAAVYNLPITLAKDTLRDSVARRNAFFHGFY